MLMLSRFFSILGCFLLFTSIIFAQKVTTSKFGDISYEMTQKQVAALTANKLALYDVNNPEMPEQDIELNGIKYHISYYRNLKTKQFEVYMVSSVSAQLSTLSGIKIGSSLDDLWKAYKKYDISVQDIFEDDETKSFRAFAINDLDKDQMLINAVTCLEVVEHLENPLFFFQNIMSTYHPQLIIFSTQLYQDKPPKPDTWWYYSFITGQHISFFQHRTLKFCSQQLQMHYISYQGLHIFSKMPVKPIWLRLAFSKIGYFISYVAKLIRSSLIASDYQKLITSPSQEQKHQE